MAWLSLLSPVGALAARFAEQVVYNTTHDGAIKTAIRWGHSLKEFLDHEDVKVHWSRIAGPPPEQTPEAPAGGNAGVRPDVWEAITSALQDDNDANVDASAVKAQEVMKQTGEVEAAEILAFMEEAKQLVRASVQTVDGSLSLQALSEIMRGQPLAKLLGSGGQSVLFWYDVEASGEHATDGRRSSAPFMRPTCAKVIHAALSIRGNGPLEMDESGEPCLPDPRASDVLPGLNNNQRQ